MDNYYKILGVSPKASQDEIKERFRFLANAYHPDKFASPAHKADAETEFKKINQAYQTLSVPAKRLEYDRRLGISPAANSSGPSNPRPKPTAPSSNLYAAGQSIIRLVAYALVFYLISFIAWRMGIGGVVLFLILLGIIYAKYFWK